MVDDIADEIILFGRKRTGGLMLPKHEIKSILKKHLFPAPEIQDCIPVILYFPDHAEADAFVAMVKQVKPNMEERHL